MTNKELTKEFKNNKEFVFALTEAENTSLCLEESLPLSLFQYPKARESVATFQYTNNINNQAMCCKCFWFDSRPNDSD